MTPHGHDSCRTNGHSNTLPASTTPSVTPQESQGKLAQYTAHQTDVCFLPQVIPGKDKKGTRLLEVQGLLKLPMPKRPPGLQTAGLPALHCPCSQGTSSSCPGRKPCQSDCPMLGPRIYSRDPYHPGTEATRGDNRLMYSECNSNNLSF